MGRGRIQMEVIEKEKPRKIAFQNRKKGLMKKAYEISTLCGVDVGVIIYAPKFLDEHETWPQDSAELKRVIQKYHNITSDRRSKVYDVQEYFKDRMKKIDGEISKVQKEKIKLMYPTWDHSLNILGEEQLRMFISIVDAKLDVCNQRMNFLKPDSKAETLTSYTTSNFMHNMFQTQLSPPSDHNNQLPCQSSMFHFDQNCTQLMEDWTNYQLGVGACDPKMGVLKEDVSDKNQNSSSCYYNVNKQTRKPYMQTLSSDQPQYNATFQILPDQSVQPPGFEFNEFYDSNMLQTQFFNYMQGRN